MKAGYLASWIHSVPLSDESQSDEIDLRQRLSGGRWATVPRVPAFPQ